MKVLVGVIMGSSSDWETMQCAADTLASLRVPHETRVISAHRTPDLLFEYAASARDRGLRVIIAGAKNAALFAAAILAHEHAEIRVALDGFRAAQTAAVLAKPDPRIS
jgi:5-(carboxyamino)imidazole ribonucleotide mutase